ncbi:MAG: methionine biosynthesis protein MetW, partial [Haliea sp.]|nr:methionine biosynthesis protein MetW [Haliea sp.]
MRLDLTHIQRWIAPGSKVLDLGCGDGEFLQRLEAERDVRGLGLEIDPDKINKAVARGLNVVEQDMDAGLTNFPDQSFDTVVMAHALQAVHYPDRVLEEMLRIGRQGIVTFPNFAHWNCRLYLG